MTTLYRTRSSPWYITNWHHPKNWKETGIPQRAVSPEYTFMAADVLRVVFVCDLASGVLLTISLRVLLDCCDTYASGGMDGFFHSLPLSCASRHSGCYQGVLLASGFSLIGADTLAFCHTLCPARHALRDYCRLQRDQYELGGIVSGVAFLTLHRSMAITFRVLPNSLDETMFRQTFGNLSRSPSAETRPHRVSLWRPVCWRGGWQVIQHPVGLLTAPEVIWHGRDADQFFGATTFESQSLTENGAKHVRMVFVTLYCPLSADMIATSHPSGWVSWRSARSPSKGVLQPPVQAPVGSTLSLARGSASLRQASDLGAVSQLTVFSAVCHVQRFGFLIHRRLVDRSSHTLVLDIMSSLSHLVRQRIHIHASVSGGFSSDSKTCKRRSRRSCPCLFERKQAKAFTLVFFFPWGWGSAWRHSGSLQLGLTPVKAWISW